MATSTQDWIEELKGISVLELSERIKALEEAFGVSATAVGAAAPAAAGRGGRGAAGGGGLRVPRPPAGLRALGAACGGPAAAVAAAPPAAAGGGDGAAAEEESSTVDV